MSEDAFCSWSGGKDCCLALHRYIQQGKRVSHLFTMMIPELERTCSHGMRREVLEAQAHSLGMALTTRAATWAEYRDRFITGLQTLSTDGVTEGVFGDIDLEDHLTWTREVCEECGIKAIHPLWHGKREELLEEFLGLGYQATFIGVKDGCLDPSLVGQKLDHQSIAILADAGVDLCGEKGEYHTVVTDGPLFSTPLHLEFDEPVLRDGVWVADARLAEAGMSAVS